MCEFFRNLNIEVQSSDGDMLCPIFGQQRGAVINLPNLTLNLEERTDIAASPVFNLTIFDYPESEVRKICDTLDGKREVGIHGPIYTFTSPDGGLVCVGVRRH
ncbi:hypothetical protein [Persicirhabdus sediminis]|nr:hypothetical protein [Persicirhabdus sediminis]